MDWIGITGMMGAGKTTVSQTIEQMGYPVIYADEVAHSILAPGAPGFQEVVTTFGVGVLNRDKTLNRSALAKLVFAHRSQLSKLEAITHPRIQAKVREFQDQCEQQAEPLAFYDVPLLFEKQLQSRFDVIVCVVADREVVLERLKKREGWSEQEITERLDCQLPQSEKEEGAQYVLQNNSSLEELKAQIVRLINDLLTNPKRNPHRK
jgi:dephospho-CoA kinase